MKRTVSLFAIVVLAIGVTTAQAAHLDNPNRLGDPSFEGTITTDGAPFVGTWEGFTGGAGAGSDFGTDMPRTGAQALQLLIENSPNNFAGAFQDAEFSPGLAGNMAWFSGWHKLDGDAGGSEIRIEWRDSVNNTEISRTQITDSPVGSDYEEFIIADVIPAGADSARVVYAIQSFGTAQNQRVFVDDVNFNVVPEPGTIALLGLASAVGFVAIRRRK